MVNFGLNSASILGIFLAVAGAGLYFLRSVRPELARDHDIFFAAVGLLCGLILLFQGWRLDPILQFGQFLLTGSAIFFAVESIRLRGATVEQAKRSSPIVDRDRPVSRTRVYTQAELDELEPYEEETRYDNPRLKGYDESRGSRRSRYSAEDTRSSPSRRTSEGYDAPDTRSRRSRPKSSSSGYDSYDSWENPSDMWDESSSSRRRPRSPSQDPYSESSEPPKKRRPRSTPSSYENYYPESEPGSTDYVDYQPLDSPESFDSDSDWEQTPEREEPPRPRPKPPKRDDFEDEPTQDSPDNPIRFDY